MLLGSKYSEILASILNKEIKMLIITWYMGVASRVAERLKDLRKLGNIKKMPKPHRMIA